MKFPRTPHLADLGGKAVTRDDLLFSKKDAEKWIGDNVITVEEKVDGANLGISICPDTLKFMVQNRSHFVNSSTAKQFARLDEWLEEHAMELHAVLKPGRHVLFGEWLALQHSVRYTALPDVFLAFDVFDKKKGRFLSKARRDRLLAKTTVRAVRCIARRRFPGGVKEIAALLEATPSGYCEPEGDEGGGVPMEGVYLRRECVASDDAGQEAAKARTAGRAGDAPLASAVVAGAGSLPVEAATGSGAEGGSDRGSTSRAGAGAGTGEAKVEERRGEDKDDEREQEPRWLESRCKLVRAEFVAGIDGHWSKGVAVKNTVLVGEDRETWGDAE